MLFSSLSVIATRMRRRDIFLIDESLLLKSLVHYTFFPRLLFVQISSLAIPSLINFPPCRDINHNLHLLATHRFSVFVIYAMLFIRLHSCQEDGYATARVSFPIDIRDILYIVSDGFSRLRRLHKRQQQHSAAHVTNLLITKQGEFCILFSKSYS